MDHEVATVTVERFRAPLYARRLQLPRNERGY